MTTSKPISWNEIRDQAVIFATRWRGETRENAEAQTFWNEWFAIFGIDRRRVVQFEKKASRQSTGGRGRLDAFWEGQIAVEHKSAGKSLEDAEEQALDYLNSLGNVEQPRMIITSDFANFRVLDLEKNQTSEFALEDLPQRVNSFGFLAGYETRTFKPEHEVNVRAAEMMGHIYDVLNDAGYGGHDLNIFLVRLMFLFFADDTGVWQKGLFGDFLENRTSDDGTDIGPMIERLFRVLNTPEEKRSRDLDESLRSFPYVNGGLFQERIDIPDFNKRSRQRVLECSAFDWSKVSPAIFGSMFQAAMESTDPGARRALGAHYTTEQNTLKVIQPLFLDELRSTFEASRDSVRKLRELQSHIAGLTFFDPAAGSGNFLVVTYRELRRVEFEILVRLEELAGTGQQHLSISEISELSKLNVDQFYGIDIEEFPARITETALYLVDHLENMRLSQHFGQYFARIPLRAQAHIYVGNALALDWNEVLPAKECSYVLGNPPFIGKQHRSQEQKTDMSRVFDNVRGHGVLDYVAAWYRKAIDYVSGHTTRVAFVSTNSIVQGEQVPALWPDLLRRGLVIDFAHRTFNWSSEARGRAQVHVVVIGFRQGTAPTKKLLYDHADIAGQERRLEVPNINPYLVNAPTVIAEKRRRPLVEVPPARFGSMPNDGGHLILDETTRNQLIAQDPVAFKYVRELIGAHEMLNGEHRYCLWLSEADPHEVRSSPFLHARVSSVRSYRHASTRSATRALADSPRLFGEVRQPKMRYLCLPRHSSQARRYIPSAFFEPEHIAHDSTLTVEGAGTFEFGILSSEMFMVWVRSVAGRIKSDFRLSAELVYNTFPWPHSEESDRSEVESLASTVLESRNAFPSATLADLYEPTSSPPVLVDAHHALDRKVERLYGRTRPKSELERQALLFERYALLNDAGTLQTSSV